MSGIVALALLLVGCAAPSDRRFPGREVVRVWHPWSGEDAATIQAIADRFNLSQSRYEAIPLSVPGGDETKTKFMLAVSGGDPPDLVATWDPVLPLWARDGIAQPLDPWMSSTDRAAYAKEFPVARRAGEYRGKVYGLSVGLNLFGLYYRPDLLRAAGLPGRAPRTLEELADWGDRLNVRKADGSLARWGLAPGGLRDLGPLFGGGYEEGRIDTPGNLAALRWMAERRAKVGFKEVQRFQVGIGLDAGGNSSEAGWPFVMGRYAMAMDGQWRVGEIAKSAPEFAHLYRTAPLPPRVGGFAGAGYAVATLIALPAGARHAAGAWAFARFWGGLSDPKGAAALYVRGGWLPSSPAMAAAPAYRDYVRRVPQFGSFLSALAAPGLQTAPPVAYQAYLADAAGKAEWNAISGDQPADVALRDAQRDLDHELLRRRALGERF